MREQRDIAGGEITLSHLENGQLSRLIFPVSAEFDEFSLVHYLTACLPRDRHDGRAGAGASAHPVRQHRARCSENRGQLRGQAPAESRRPLTSATVIASGAVARLGCNRQEEHCQLGDAYFRGERSGDESWLGSPARRRSSWPEGGPTGERRTNRPSTRPAELRG